MDVSQAWCGPLAAWTSAWIAGTVSLDEAVDAVTGGSPHRLAVAGPQPELAGLDGAGLAEALVHWRRSGQAVRAVLPAPGDVRGLPPLPPVTAAATQAGQAAVGGGLAVVPEVVDHGAGAQPVVLWRVWAVPAAAPDHLSVADAQHELAEAVRETAGALTAAEVAGSSAGAAAGLTAARRAGDAPNLPRGFPPRAVALVSQAERLQAVLDLALLDPVGGAVDRAGVAARTAALRPLVTAVRRARAAGYNALTE